MLPTRAIISSERTRSLRGRDAQEKMYEIVLAPQAERAYETGEMRPLQASAE